MTVLCLLLAFWSIPVSHAETITVDTCSVDDLIAAIDTANATPDDDLIELNGTCIYTLTAVHHRGNFGDDSLPNILDMNAAGTLTINGNGATIPRRGASPCAPSAPSLPLSTTLYSACLTALITVGL